MSYKNLVNQACANKIEYFCRMRDFICKRNGTYDYSTAGIGWTLHDSSYAVDEDNPAIGDWYVIKSVGENGNEDLYFKIEWVSTYVTMKGYLYWNNSTHAGVYNYNSTGNMYLVESGASTLYVYGDLDFINYWETTNLGGGYPMVAFGGKLANTPYDTTVATSSSSASAGSDVSITVDAVPSSWAVGKKIYLRDNADVEQVTIKTLASLTITADLTDSYAAGFKLQEEIGYTCNSSYSSMGNTVIVNRTTGAAPVGATAQLLNSYSSYANPDDKYSERPLWPYHSLGADGYYGTLPNIYGIALTGLTAGDVLTDSDGNTYRYFKYYSSLHLAMLEV